MALMGVGFVFTGACLCVYFSLQYLS